jgi:anti-sigma B factor antagonist
VMRLILDIHQFIRLKPQPATTYAGTCALGPDRWLQNIGYLMSEMVLGGVPPGSIGFTLAKITMGSVVVVAVSGDLDMLTSPALAGAVDAAARNGPSALIVDLSKVTFLASAGINLLAALHHDVTFMVPFAVVADGPITGRPLKLVGIDQIVALYPTLEQALAGVADA